MADQHDYPNPALHHSGERHPVVENLLLLLEEEPSLREVLLTAISRTQRFAPPFLDSYCTLLQAMLTTVPNPTTWLPMNLEFYYVLHCSPDALLGDNPSFAAWMREFVDSLGRFLDSPASVAKLSDYINDPSYEIEDYAVNPSGWLTFNQFFARQMKPGRRPVAGRQDDAVVVSPVDGVFKGYYPIDNDTQISVKGLTWTVMDLLDGSPFAGRFAGGWFAHSFLAPYNYHRFHTPVGGVVRELRTVTGRLALEVVRAPDGGLSVVKDSIGYQFTQERGLAVMESPVGFVAVIPVGMGIVSSVTFTADPGALLEKGDELGYFSFGGSDVVLLFESRARIDFSVRAGQDVRQGQAIALTGLL